jgi:hypothetical protein
MIATAMSPEMSRIRADRISRKTTFEGGETRENGLDDAQEGRYDVHPRPQWNKLYLSIRPRVHRSFTRRRCGLFSVIKLIVIQDRIRINVVASLSHVEIVSLLVSCPALRGQD